MAVYTHDSRLAEADRAYSRWVRQGAPPAVVQALLPMLVGPLRTQQAAEAWLSRHALVGHDLSEQGQAQDRQLVNEARALQNSALNSGAFTGTQVFTPPPGRYNASENAVNDALDARAPQAKYPGSDHNKSTLQLAEVERQMQAKHGPTATLSDNGDVHVTHPHTLQRIKVDHVDVPSAKHNRIVSETEAPRRRRTTDLSNHSDAEWDTIGQNVPFFMTGD